jgi:hypothetical protein
MAILTQTATKLVTFGTAATLVAAGTIDATLGAQFTPAVEDEKLVYTIYGGSAGGTVTVEMGNGIQGVADLDLVIGAGATIVIQLESGKYKNVSGTNKGKIMFTSTVADSTLSVYELA